MNDEQLVPIIDCPLCGAKDVPLSHEGSFVRHETPEIRIDLYTCSACGKVPNVEEDLVIKRWVSMVELEAMGYKRISRARYLFIKMIRYIKRIGGHHA